MSWIWSDYATQSFLRGQNPVKRPDEGRVSERAPVRAEFDDEHAGPLAMCLFWGSAALVGVLFWLALILIYTQISGSA